MFDKVCVTLARLAGMFAMLLAAGLAFGVGYEVVSHDWAYYTSLPARAGLIVFAALFTTVGCLFLWVSGYCGYRFGWDVRDLAKRGH